MKETVFVKMMKWSKDRGWNQSDVASRLGLLPQHISNWKRRGVPSDRLADISRLFESSIETLLGLDDDRPARTHRPWPFKDVDEAKVRAFTGKPEIIKLEAAILIAAAQVGLDIKKD